MSSSAQDTVHLANDHAVAGDSSVVAFRQNYSDIDSATNDLLIPQKNTQTALKSFLTLVEADARKAGITFDVRKTYFPSPLENSSQSDMMMQFGNVTLARFSFFSQGKDLSEIHTKRGSTLNPKTYPVALSIALRTPDEIAYEFGLDSEKDARGITALTRPFKIMLEGQPYQFGFEENGAISKQESQVSRLHDHFNTVIAQLLFAMRQLGIEKREPSFVARLTENQG